MALPNIMIMQDYGISVCLTLTPYLPHELFSAMKSYFSKYILPVSIFTLPLSLSPSVSAFTLPEAWRAAQQHSADFQASHYQRDAVRARQQQAKAAFLPHVSANASYQRQPPSISSTRETQGWSVQVGQTLFDAAKFAQYRQSRFDTQAAEQRFDAAREELLLKVAESYFNVLLSRDTIAAHAAEKEAYAQQVRQAQALFNKGAATALDIHEAKAGYDNALAQEIAVLAEKQTYENQLNDYTGLDSKQIEAIDTANLLARYLPKLERYSLDEWQRIALSNNHEYRMQQLALQGSGQALRAAQNSRYPTVSAHVGYQNNLYTSSAQNNDYHYRGKGMSIGVQLNMPLYTGGELSGKIHEAEAQYGAASAQLTATERHIKLAVRQAYTESGAARYQIMAQERVLESSRLKLKSTETGQQYGIRNRLEVIRARQEVAQAEQKLAQARYKFMLAYLRLVKESGLGLETVFAK